MKYSFKMIGMVKTPFFQSQSAGVWVKKKLIFFDYYKNKNQFSTTITAPQRLNAREQAWLTGMCEADGSFGVHKNGKYVQYEFMLELHKSEKPMLQQLKNKLKVSANVKLRKTRDTVVLKIRRKKDLIEKICPIFDKFPMIGVKKYQYLFFREHLLEKNTIYFNEVDFQERHRYKNEKTLQTPIEKVKDVQKVPYLDAWLVGFINGEGCFSVYKANKETNKTCSFSMNQTLDGKFLMNLVKEKLKLENRNVFFEKKSNCYTLKTTSVKNIANVLKFLNKAPTKLLGNKRIQYLIWAKNIRTNKRYITIKVPRNLSSFCFQI